MAEILMFRGQSERDWASFEARQRAFLRSNRIESAAIDHALREFRPIFEDLRASNLTLEIAEQNRQPFAEMQAYCDELLDRLAKAMLLQSARFFAMCEDRQVT